MEFTHYFNYLPPTIPEGEEEIFYRHPNLPFCMNQLGVIYEDDDYSVNYVKDEDIRIYCLSTNKYIATGRRARFSIECYTNQIIDKERASVVYLDGNSQNNSFHNLKLREDLTIKQIKQAKDNKDRFRELSLNYLKQVEKKLLAKGLDTNRYFKFMKLPSWMGVKIHNGVEFTAGVVLSDKLPNAKNYQRMLEIVRMYEDGMTQNAIMERFGFSSRNQVRYWIQKYEIIEGRDIYRAE